MIMSIVMVMMMKMMSSKRMTTTVIMILEERIKSQWLPVVIISHKSWKNMRSNRQKTPSRTIPTKCLHCTHYHYHCHLFVYQSATYSQSPFISFPFWNFHLTTSRAAAQVQGRGWHGLPLPVEDLQPWPTGPKVEGDILTPENHCPSPPFVNFPDWDNRHIHHFITIIMIGNVHHLSIITSDL